MSIKIGIIKESKIPPDTRVPLTPKQCKLISENYPSITIKVQGSDNRCYSDKEYSNEGVQVSDSVEDCDILLGVKEVPMDQLIPSKTYLFFSHTIKEQPYNQQLLKKIVERDIHMIDYECLTNDSGMRVIAFGRWAGIVGAYNGLYTWGKKTGFLNLKRVGAFNDYESMKASFSSLTIDPLKIVVTGDGRVANGAAEVLEAMGIKRTSVSEFANVAGVSEAVYTQLSPCDIYERQDGGEFYLSNFFNHPEEYTCDFSKFYKGTDLMINAIYWDPKAPIYFTKEEMRSSGFRIKAIADITCDIEGSIPATLKATTIDDPIFGYDPITEKATEPFGEHTIDIMSVDNLPNELPRDASEAFGSQLIEFVIPELLNPDSKMIERATIAQKGNLGLHFEYLRNYLEGR